MSNDSLKKPGGKPVDKLDLYNLEDFLDILENFVEVDPSDKLKIQEFFKY